ncbi:MAG: hypothetical protein ACWGMZ_01665 [Thermoguttaceae bacterium]
MNQPFPQAADFGKSGSAQTSDAAVLNRQQNNTFRVVASDTRSNKNADGKCVAESADSTIDLPRANTDLDAMFKDDNVCAVCRSAEKAASSQISRLNQQHLDAAMPKMDHATDPTLLHLIERWPSLSPKTRSAIFALVAAAEQ